MSDPPKQPRPLARILAEVLEKVDRNTRARYGLVLDFTGNEAVFPVVVEAVRAHVAERGYESSHDFVYFPGHLITMCRITGRSQ